MSCQSKRSDVIGLHERGVKQVAQRDLVARLKSDVVFPGADKCLRRNADHLTETASFFFRPIQYDCGRGDLGQTADLPFVFRFLLLQHVTGLRIDNDVSLRGSSRADLPSQRGKRSKSDRESV